jgi:hypothetical protein
MRFASFVAALALALPATAAAAPRVGGCPVFPKDNAWNKRVDELPVASNSDAIVRSIGVDATMHADFGSGIWDGGPIGIPFVTVGGGQPRVHVGFDYASESDKGPYPIPRSVPIEGGRNADGDRHVIVVDRSRCRLYELFAAYPRAGGARWSAGSGAIWNLRSNHLRPRGWTSADAAGLPILPGLARYDEVKRGHIDHALRFTAERTRQRLKRSFDVSHFPRQARIVLRALKRYGMILADNGSPWYVSGAPNSHWSNDQLHTLGRVPGRAFEVLRFPRH